MTKDSGYILIPCKVARRKDLSAAHKLILGELGRLQGDKASSFPSYESLVEATGISRRQVARIVRDLKEQHEATILRVPYQSNTYAVPWATARAQRKYWALRKAEAKTGTGRGRNRN